MQAGFSQMNCSVADFYRKIEDSEKLANFLEEIRSDSQCIFARDKIGWKSLSVGQGFTTLCECPLWYTRQQSHLDMQQDH